MKRLILVIMIIGLAGCASVPPYSGPIIPVSGVSSGISHRVEAGQTLWRISRMYNVDIDDILRLNRISENAVIEPGQVLLIPNRTNPQDYQVKGAQDDFIWPLRGRVIAPFGANYRNLINKGINIQASFGADIIAVRSGKVVFYADKLGNFGKSVIIDHGDGLRSVYSRFSEVFVHPGVNVQRGELIGRVGTSARDKDCYLHFEVRKGALPQNPLYYLP